MAEEMLIFIAMAAFVNLVTYGGITLIYFRDKHRSDLPHGGAAGSGERAPESGEDTSAVESGRLAA